MPDTDKHQDQKPLYLLIIAASAMTKAMRDAYNSLTDTEFVGAADLKQTQISTIATNARLLEIYAKKISSAIPGMVMKEVSQTVLSGENSTEVIIQKFGGVAALSRLLGHKNMTTVSGWKTRNNIPARQQRILLKIAPMHGVQLSPSDFFPSTDQEA